MGNKGDFWYRNYHELDTGYFTLLGLVKSFKED